MIDKKALHDMMLAGLFKGHTRLEKSMSAKLTMFITVLYFKHVDE